MCLWAAAQAFGVASLSASDRTRQPSLSRCFKNFYCPFLPALLLFPPAMGTAYSRLPEAQNEKEQGVQRSSQESSDLSGERDINHCHYKLLRLGDC